MRVLHLDAGREMRGGQWQALRLIEGLAASGIESTLLARDGAPLFSAARKYGWRVEPISLTRAVLMARRHDLIHAHDARAHTLGSVVRSGRLLVSRRVAFPVGSRWKYSRAAHYIAVSEFVRGVLIQGGVAAERITVVYDGVPVLEPAGPPRLLVAHEKSAPLAADSARLAGVELTLSKDLERDLPRAALFVYVTHSEGLGSGVLLAMSAGVPVVASNVGGLPEVIRDGENGLLVENTPQAIAEGIRRILGDPGFARRIGAEARRTVLERFTLDRMVRHTMEVYRQVLK
jgi:hypothetical protein